MGKVETGEEMQFHHLRQARVAGFQRLHGGIQAEQVVAQLGCGQRIRVEGGLLLAATALLRGTVARRIEQDLAHGARGNGEEMRAVVQRQERASQFQVGLVNQQGGRQGAVAATGKLQVRRPPQILIDRLEQLVVGGLVTGSAALHQGQRILRGNLCRMIHAPKPCAETNALPPS